MRNFWNAIYAGFYTELVLDRARKGIQSDNEYLRECNGTAGRSADDACDVRWAQDPNPDSYDEFPRCQNCLGLNNLIPNTCPRPWCVNNHPRAPAPMSISYGLGYDTPLRVTFPADPVSLQAMGHQENELGIVLRRDEAYGCSPPITVFVPTTPLVFRLLAGLTSMTLDETERSIQAFKAPRSSWERLISDEDPLDPGPPDPV
jgi:hypothetical protein